MALPICIEFFIRTFFHILKFAFSHTSLILFILFIGLLSFVFKRSIKLVLGFIGFGINFLGAFGLPAFVTPFFEAFAWGGMALNANMFFLGKFVLVPIMMVFGFSWDLISGVTYVPNFIPLSIVVALLMESVIFNWLIVIFAVLLNPLFLILATIFKIAGFSNICTSLNGLLTKFGSFIILPASPKLLKTYFNLLKKWQKNLE
ncbi:hypothetical protein CL618_03165 [archaeon]|nr:hypothetical protein [archaeon]|tara:strand:- start:776 stop:1384 length:609 start_codon:yes stop_codon:yes gene_type:complete